MSGCGPVHKVEQMYWGDPIRTIRRFLTRWEPRTEAVSLGLLPLLARQCCVRIPDPIQLLIVHFL